MLGVGSVLCMPGAVQGTGDHEGSGDAQAVCSLQLCWSFDLPVILFHQVNPDYEEDDLECQSSVSIGEGIWSCP